MKYKKVFLKLLTGHNFEQQLINFREQMGNTEQVVVFIFKEPQLWIESTNDRKLSSNSKWPILGAIQKMCRNKFLSI